MRSALRWKKNYFPTLLVTSLSLLSCPLAVFAQAPEAASSPQSEESTPASKQAEKTAAQPLPVQLELHKPVTRELQGGEAGIYEIQVKKGQFLRVSAEQDGIDVVLTVFDPAGKVLVEANSPNGTWGPEPASVLCEAAGIYQVRVKSAYKKATAGKYTITITDLRKPKPGDRERIAAESALFAAALLDRKSDSDSMQKALELFEKASPLWIALHDSYEEALSRKSIAALRGRIGGTENYKLAIEDYNRALLLERGIQDKHGLAETLNLIGRIYDIQGENQKAIEYFNQALAAERDVGNRRLEATTLSNIGVVYARDGEKQKALEYLGQALSLRREAGDRGAEAATLVSIGGVYGGSGEEKKALEYYREALPLQRAAGDRKGVASTLNHIANVYLDLGEGKRALEYYNLALPLERAAGDRGKEAATLSNIGTVYTNLGEKQKALDYLQQALALRPTVGDHKGEAINLVLIGNVYGSLGEERKALEYYNRALLLQQAVGDRREIASTLNDIGGVYSVLGEKRKALEYFNQALPLRRAVGDPRGEAVTLNSLGMVYSDLGEKQKALEYHNQALPLRRAVGDRSGESATLNNIGLVYRALGENRKALEYYHQALQLERNVGNPNSEATTLLNIGRIQTILGEKQKALECFNASLVLYREVQNTLGEGTILNVLMSYWKGEKNTALAIFFGKQSVNAFQQIRKNIQGLDEDVQKTFVQSKAGAYRDLGSLLIGQGRLSEAQVVLDLLKQQEYFDFVRGGERAVEARSLPISLNPEEQKSREAYEKIAGQITSVGVEYSDLRIKRSRTPEEEAHMAQLKEKLTVANQEMGRFFKTLYVDFGKNSQANQSAENVREQASGLQSIVRELGAGTVALYTLVGETRYSVILITGSTMQAREYAIDAADLRRKVAVFLEALKNPARDPLPASQDLYKILVAPIAEDLKGARAETLMWSLNDVLRYVPVAALHDGKQYLVENYRNVVITPASIGRLKDKVELGNSSIAGMGVSKDYDGLGPLPAVPGELKHIIHDEKVQGAGGGLPGTLILDDDFTEARLASALDKHYPVVHIASHFVLQAGNETNSYLLLGGKDVGGKGYHLTLAELRDDPALTFDGIELLTLSACQTGASGTALDGREVDGLGITAQQKGAKAVLASLWSVADESTALFMADFYKQWLGTPGITKVSALRQAQLNMLHGTVKPAESAEAARGATKNPADKKPATSYTHPFYWAPFILIGNWK